MIATPIEPEIAHGTVCAVVVTFNRKELLRRCLLALEPQMGPRDLILVVDNACTDGTGAVLDAEFPELDRLTLPENVGGSGGFHAGVKWAYDRGYDWMWLMDDDGVPEPDCLSILLRQADSSSVLVPLQRDSGGRVYGISAWRRRNVDVTGELVAGQIPARGPYMFAFVGPLLPRGLVDAIGLPRPDFFIWFDDGEYSLRIMDRSEYRVKVVPEAVFRHDMGENSRIVRFLGIRSVRSELAAWKIYYGVRNQLYTLLRARRKPIELGLFGLVHMRLLLMDAIYGPERGRRVGLRIRGVCDGLLGRLGKRI